MMVRHALGLDAELRGEGYLYFVYCACDWSAGPYYDEDEAMKTWKLHLNQIVYEEENEEVDLYDQLDNLFR